MGTVPISLEAKKTFDSGDENGVDVAKENVNLHLNGNFLGVISQPDLEFAAFLDKDAMLANQGFD